MERIDKEALESFICSITNDVDELPLADDKAAELITAGQEASDEWPGRRRELVPRVWGMIVEDLTTHGREVKRMWTDTSSAEREALAVLPLVFGASLTAYPQVTTNLRTVLMTIQWQACVRAFLVGLHMSGSPKATWFMRLRSLLKAQRMPPLLPDDKIDSYRQQTESALQSTAVDLYLARLAAALVAEHSSRSIELAMKLRQLLSGLTVRDMEDLEAYYGCCEDLLRYAVGRSQGVQALMVWVVHAADRALLIGHGLEADRAAT